MRTHFTAELRILLCESCGAPLELPVGGGQASCRYCQAVNVVSLRDERPTLGIPAAALLPEEERLARLRMQDGRPLVPPQSLLALLPGGRVEAWRAAEVVTVFNQTRKEVKLTGSPDAAERLYFLTLALSNHLGEANELDRLRAVLETALDTLSLPRHRQTLRGMLCRNAVREGDAAAAERWLAPCDPRSDDLESDSSFRVSRAMIDTARGDFGAVVRLLGASETEVPIADVLDANATVLRANALERSGQIDAAVACLERRMQGGRSSRDAVEAFVRGAPNLRLCEQSLPRARNAHTEQAAASAGSGFRVMGWIMLVTGGFLVLLALVLGVVLGGGGLALGSVVGGAAMPGLIGGMLGVCGGPGVAGAVMIAIGAWMLRTGQAASQLRRDGIPGSGVVVSVQGTGVRINHVPVYALRLRVEVPQQAPYETELRQAFAQPPGPGTRLPLRIDPKQPTRVALEE